MNLLYVFKFFFNLVGGNGHVSYAFDSGAFSRYVKKKNFRFLRRRKPPKGFAEVFTVWATAGLLCRGE